ncbi:hypothetical protein, partial [Lysinibacillus composti]|uniref:hypothetical protein n=1 Tax=Lysinibacillus composti TaxID=720633 RepID=UPI001960E43E
VLGTPPAFVLSQDQTLHKRKFDKAQILAGINLMSKIFVSYKETSIIINVLLFSFQGSFTVTSWRLTYNIRD